MDFEIDKAMRERLEEVAERGRVEARPVGLEADRLGRPIPVGDPYFEKLIARGEGRTRWPGPDGRNRPQGSRSTRTTVMALLPMALGLAGASKSYGPFAASITFGLIVAMVGTLFAVPLLGTDIHAPTAAILYQLREVAMRGGNTRVAEFEQHGQSINPTDLATSRIGR